MGTLGERGDGGASRAALMGFREAFFACLSGWADALFELADAALCGPASVGSVPSLRACSRILPTARPSRDTSEARQGGPSTA